ncbi:hypothetical protein EMCG_02784 [[Emmonsia] crescens]|uniref:Uncharacterized protein n=1 Tax=[Emmonsia] crescens TaxID=73230 RepID=A0A0G2HYG4_9EURO|nr:hypothetical protein EMCG_02784 [Emmonsia crescens UAMH 3008]
MNPFAFSPFGFNFRRQPATYTRGAGPYVSRDFPNTTQIHTASRPLSRPGPNEEGMFRPPAILSTLFPAEVENGAEPEPEDTEMEDGEVIDLICDNESSNRPDQNSRQLPDNVTRVHSGFLQRRQSGKHSEPKIENGTSRCSTQRASAEVDDNDAAESWLRLRLQREEDLKSRTRVITDLPVNSGTSKRGRFQNHSQVKQDSQAKKRFNQSAANLKKTREDLDGYLAKDPQHKKALEERQLCQIYKKKVDRGEALTAGETDRLGRIRRNTSRRECSFESKMKSDLDSCRKNRQLHELPKVGVDAESNPSYTKLENDSFEPHSRCSSSTLSDATPGLSQRKTISGKTIRGGKFSSGYSRNAPPRILSSSAKNCLDGIGDGGGGKEETGEEDGEEEEEEEPSEDDEDEETMEECGQGETFWSYSVYQSTEGDFQDEEEPKCLETYFSRAKAEAKIRKQILRLQAAASIQERKRIECRIILEDNGLHAQVICFASSGRTVTVYMEKEVVEAAELSKTAQLNLSILPCRVYSVVEQVIDPLNADVPIGSPVWSECFVLRQHANEQANRRLLSYLTSYAENDETYNHIAGGTLEVDQGRYLRDLEDGERLFDRKIYLPAGPGGNTNTQKKHVVVRVVEQLLRGPRN